MSETRQKCPALAGHEAFVADQTGTHRNIEQPLRALAGHIDRAIAVAVGKQACKAAFEFGNLVCLHLSDPERHCRSLKSHNLLGLSLQR